MDATTESAWMRAAYSSQQSWPQSKAESQTPVGILDCVTNHHQAAAAVVGEEIAVAAIAVAVAVEVELSLAAGWNNDASFGE